MPYDSSAIANEFLNLAEVDGDSITHMKLQKLVYYAHGWHLAIQKTPLINERIEAWKFGPVVPSLYHEFKTVGAGPIESRAVAADFQDGKLRLYTPYISTSEGTLIAENEFASQLVSKIWTQFRRYSAVQLSEATHRPGTPWHQVRTKYGDVKNLDIPDELIQRYFESLAARGRHLN